jgi:hypothetical protein
MVVLLIVIGTYVLGYILGYKWIQIAHSKGGQYEGLSMGGFDLFMIFCPIVNLGWIVIWLTNSPKEHEEKKNLNVKRFFNVKDRPKQ